MQGLQGLVPPSLVLADVEGQPSWVTSGWGLAQEAWELRLSLLCLCSAVPVPNPLHSPWSFGEWEKGMEAILLHPLLSKLRGSHTMPWEVGARDQQEL